RELNLLDGGRPFYRVYRCADGRFVAVGPLEPKFYRQLLELTGLDTEIDPPDQYRGETWPDTTARLEKRFAERTRDEWAARAESLDACVSPVLDFLEAARHPHNLANGLYESAPFPRTGEVLRFA